MESHRFRLLSASYRRMSDDKVYIELFGKTDDKRSIVALYEGYNPYYFIVGPNESMEKALRLDPDVIETKMDSLFFKGQDRDVLKVTIRSPWKMSEYRNEWQRRGYDVLSADIPFHLKFMYDMDLTTCLEVSGEPIDLGYSVDLTIVAKATRNIESFDPGLRILSFDLENSIEKEFIYTICAVVEEDGVYRNCEPLVGRERDIIENFAKLIRDEDPDVITGYNIDNYDIRKVMERAKANRMIDALPWGRDNGQPKLIGERFWRIKGRIIVDAWWAAKKALSPKQETLNAISKLVLGETKLDVDPKKMDLEWANNKEKVLEYCLKDAELALKILIAIDTVRKGMDLATVSKLSLDDGVNAGSSLLVDSLLIRAADRRKFGIPLTGKRIRDEGIEGGYVHTMNPGLYHWTCVLDFKSMYPSLIIAKNICFSTISPDGEIASPSGARFMSPERRMGLFPMILKGLMDQRDEIKKRMKSTVDARERRYLDGLQNAVKVLMNTFYGVFASSFYRFTDKAIGSAITSFARDNVKRIISSVEAEGVHVVYSDTDSVFMQSPDHSLEGAVKFGNSMAERFSQEGGTLEFEKILEPLFSHGRKKRYVGKVVWPEPKEDLLVVGYEIKRSDSFDYQSNVLMELFKRILNEENEEAVSFVRKAVQDILSKDVDVSDLVISRSCKGMDGYENPERMANVQAARKLMDLGYEFIPGMKVSWIVTDASKAPQQVEPFISGVEFKGRPDYRYYAERVAQMASRITEVFGWNEKDLMLGSQQSTLFGGDFQTSDAVAEKARPTTEVKRKGKTSSLDDFL